MKKFISRLAIIALIGTSLSGVVFADLSKTDVNFFLEKMATTSDAKKKEQRISILKSFVDLDKADIDGLKKAIKIVATKEDIEKVEKSGYSLDTALKSLDVLDKMSVSDRKTLIKSIETQDLSKMKNVINGYYKDSSGTSSSSSSGGSGSSAGGSATAVSPNIVKPVVNPINSSSSVFKDLNTHWAKNEIEFLNSKGIIKGQSEGNFNPDGKINRAEFTALIIRLLDLKEKDANVALTFKDINSSDWYYNIVKIGSQNGIINGIDESTFAPSKEITREEMITVIMRAITNKNLTSTVGSSVSIDSFSDKNNIQSWALESIDKAVKLNIIKGKNENSFDCQGKASRAEASVIIKRVFDLINK